MAGRLGFLTPLGFFEFYFFVYRGKHAQMDEAVDRIMNSSGDYFELLGIPVEAPSPDILRRFSRCWICIKFQRGFIFADIYFYIFLGDIPVSPA